MLVDLNLDCRYVYVAGRGKELEARVRQLLEAGAKVRVGTDEAPSRRLIALAKRSRTELLKVDLSDPPRDIFAASSAPVLVVLAGTEGREVETLRSKAKSAGALVYVVDMPIHNDINMPAVSRIGDVRIAISTGGKSPAMAKVLRERVERLITPEDLLQIDLQSRVRTATKEMGLDPETRRKVVYRVLRNHEIKRSLRRADMREAQRLALAEIASFKASERRRPS